MSSHRRTGIKDKRCEGGVEGLEGGREAETGITASCKSAAKNMRLPSKGEQGTKHQGKVFAGADSQHQRNGQKSANMDGLGTADRHVTCNSRNAGKNQGCLNLTPIVSPPQYISSPSTQRRKFKIFGGPTLPAREAQHQQKLSAGLLQIGKEKHEKWVHLHQIEPKIKCKDMGKDRINTPCSISHSYNAPNLCQKSKSKLKFDQTELPSIPELKIRSQTSTRLHQTLSQKQGMFSTHLSTPRDLQTKVQSSSTQQQTFIEHFHKLQQQYKEDEREERVQSDSISNIEQFDSESQYVDDEQLENLERQLQKQRKSDPHQLFSPSGLFQGFKQSQQQHKKQASKVYYQNILDCSDLNLKQSEIRPLKLFPYIPIILISLSCLLFFIQSR